MDGTTQASRNASELVDARLIVRRALDRYGGSWEEHPLSSWPESIVVSTASGRPTFLYADGSALRTYRIRSGQPVAWKSELPPSLFEGLITDAMIELTVYSETGEIIGHETSIRDERR